MERLAVVDAYILKHGKWTKELELLRETMGHLGLSESFKWSYPVYTCKGKNVVGLGAFKNHIAIWFFNGSLIPDKENKLYNAQEGKNTAMRQWRILNFDQVVEEMEFIEKYVNIAKENVHIGNVVKPKINKPLLIPELLEAAFLSDTILKSSFEELNLTKKREFVAHIDAAKREETKINRLRKIIPIIKEGKGLNDKYRK